MPVSLSKGQKISLTKGNPGLKKVVVGLGWDINAFEVRLLTSILRLFCLQMPERFQSLKILYSTEILITRPEQFHTVATISPEQVTAMTNR